MKRLHRIALTAAALEALGAAYSFVLLPRLRRWGATAEEVSRRLPGDELVADPLYTTTHAVTVRAPAEAVWPWLVQIGQNRGGFYTYDALENLAGLEVRSADRVHPEWQDLRAGEDYLTLDPDETMKMAVAVIQPPHAFVVRSGAPGEPPQEAGSLFRGEMAWTWGFYLEPAGPAETRLIIRSRAPPGGAPCPPPSRRPSASNRPTSSWKRACCAASATVPSRPRPEPERFASVIPERRAHVHRDPPVTSLGHGAQPATWADKRGFRREAARFLART